jgi:pimeloyl-ACP methyl ester carboxylesterase
MPRATNDEPGSALSKYNGEYGGIEGIVDDTAELISQLNLTPGRVILVGHSMGAIVASALSLCIQPLGVVLIGPVHPNPNLKNIFGARIVNVEKSKFFASFPLSGAARKESNNTQTAWRQWPTQYPRLLPDLDQHPLTMHLSGLYYWAKHPRDMYRCVERLPKREHLPTGKSKVLCSSSRVLMTRQAPSSLQRRSCKGTKITTSITNGANCGVAGNQVSGRSWKCWMALATGIV